MIKKSLAFGVLLICLSLVFNFTYSQTSTTSSSTTSTSSEESGDVYTRANETYKYVSSFDGTSDSKTFDNQNTKEIGSLFNYLLTLMAIFIVILVIYRLVQGALFKGIFDNIYDQKKGRKYIQTAGTALVIFILAYAVLSFINPDLTGWTLAENFIGKVRLEGINNGGAGSGGSGAYTSAFAWQCPINPGGFKETQNYVQKVQGYQKEKPWEGSGAYSGCKKYDTEFTKVASESGVPKDFLMAIGTQESSACSSLSVTSQAKAYGLMQILDGTASSAGCDSDWKSSAYKQISCSAKVLKSKQSLLQSKNRPSVGFSLSGIIQNIEGYTFDTGNANLIASYNGGPGEGLSSDGKKQAFAISSDCKGSTGSLANNKIKLPQIDKSQTVTVCGIVVSKRIEKNIQDLCQDMKAAGFDITGSYGWRSLEKQQDLWQQNCAGKSKCSPPTAVPGTSNHGAGEAIDIRIDNHTICYTPKNVCTEKDQDVFEWLKNKAVNYGLYNLPSEKWHWSTTGN